MAQRPGTVRQDPRFVADAMLGRLARYLRLLGFDTLYDAHADDAQLVKRAAVEGRVLLTRDRRLVEEQHPPEVLLVEEEEVLAQLRQVLGALGSHVAAAAPPRCSRCNEVLQPAAPAVVRGGVPQAVLRRVKRFARCPSCHRVYWEGSHVAHLRARLLSLGYPRRFLAGPEDGL